MEGHDSVHIKYIRGMHTKAVHSGTYVDPSTGAIVPPVHISSTYEVFPDEKPKYIYGRVDNPTREVFEKGLAALEGGKYCIATSSGLAAVSLIFHAIPSGNHVVVSDDLYGGSYKYWKDIAQEAQGLTVEDADLRDPKNLEALIKDKTKLVLLETPSNPTLKVMDIEALSKICKSKGIILAVDNTFFTPILQNPLELGADIVYHSCTKSIGGHSDLIMGAVITNDEKIYERLKMNSILMGTNPSPFDCFLASRGLKTLPLRVKRAGKNALKLAEILEKHPKVSKVIFPGLPNHPGHEHLKKKARGFGSMITFDIKDFDASKINAFYRRLTLFGHAVSLGGVESLVTIPLMVTHMFLTPEDRKKLGLTEGTVRLSVGIEDFEDLKDDLLNALEVIQ